MIFDRYILRNYIGPFVFSIAVITFVFIMDFILRYIDLFLGKGVKFHIVLQVFVLSLGHMFALIIPMAVLPATLMTYGTLAGENELTAMRACGFSMYRMILPGLVASCLLGGALVVYNNHVLPESNHRLLNLLIDINRKQPTVELRANRFIDDLQGYTIYFAEKNDRTGDISDVQIFKHAERNGLPTTIIAETGHLQFIEGQNVLRVDLKNGEIHELPMAKDRETYRRTTFKEYTLNIHDVDRSLQRSERDYRGDREMSVKLMEDKIQEIRSEMEVARQNMIREAGQRMDATFSLLDARDRARLWTPRDSVKAAAAARATPRMMARGGEGSGQMPVEARSEYIARQRIETEIGKRQSFVRQILRYKVEIHKKYSIPFACVIFVLVGSPLAIRMGRSGMNMAIGLSILFFLIYYVCLIGGEKLADRAITPPWFAMWSPNILFGIVAIGLLRKAAREQTVAEWTLVSALRTLFRRHAPANSR
ncbi:MAG TPA: LptF/LptG family permease [Candidatus Krumholzibacteria bacterium]|nr:LptF/LptG family permease [Candidatus Krumholzibacteria bacterium]